MTKYEIASATWRRLKNELDERAWLHMPTLDPGSHETFDALMIAMIEESFYQVAKVDQEHDEAPRWITDNTKLVVSKETEGRIKVISSLFEDRGGSVIIKPSELMVLRSDEGRVLIAKRQG